MEKIQSTVSPKKRLGEPLDTEVTIKKEKSDEPETQIESHNELEMKQVIEMSFTDDGTKVKTNPVKEQDGKTEPGTSHKGSPSKKTPGSTEKESEEYEHARQRKEKQHEDRMKMQVLVSNFTEDQLNRYEMYRRAAFPKSSVKRLMQSITNSAVPQNVVIAMSGITKVFVGEVVEAALDTKEKWGDKGPLEPKHLREGVRQLKSKNVIPSSKYSKTLLR